MKTKNEKAIIQILNFIIKAHSFRMMGKLLIILLLDQVKHLVAYINKKIKNVKNIKNNQLYQVHIDLRNLPYFNELKAK